MAVPYTFGSATTSIPLSQLDSNFATTITLGNTAIQLGNTVTTLNNMTFVNATISTLATPITTAQGGNGLTSTPTAGQVDIGNGTGFTRTTLTAGAGIAVTNGNGSITIAATGGGGDVFLAGNNAFTGANTFYNNTGQTFGRGTATQDGIIIAGRNGGSSSYRVTVTPDILTANVTLTAPNVSTTIVGTDATQTLTNKTLTTPTIATIKSAAANTQTVFQDSAGATIGTLSRAWVSFDGTSNTGNVTGTYSQTGTTVTVSITGHGYVTGNIAYLDFTSGTAVDGTYTVTVTDANTFTVTQASRTTSGNVTSVRSAIRASSNVSSVSDVAVGKYVVNFSSAISDANYSVVTSAAGASGYETMSASTAYDIAPTTTALSLYTGRPGGAGSAGQFQDSPYVGVAIFR